MSDQKTNNDMKTFEQALKDEIIRKASVMESEDLGRSRDIQALIVFESGANWASQSPELIDEILTKYQEWVDNTSGKKFADWLHEEGGHEKGKTRVRKEFINYLNEKK